MFGRSAVPLFRTFARGDHDVLISCLCPRCEGKFRVRDGAAGRAINCPHCGAEVVAPKKSSPAGDSASRRQAERRADDEFPRPRPRRKKPRSETGVALAVAGSFFALLAVVIGGIGFYLLQQGPTVRASAPREWAEEPPPAGVNTVKMRAILDARFNVHAGTEWAKEIKSATGGTVAFRITSQGPFSVTVVTERAFKTLQAKKRGGYNKNDLLLVADCPSPEYQDYVTLPPGTNYFIIRNNTTKLLHVHLECFPQ